jgi:hypothetical protein
LSLRIEFRNKKKSFKRRSSVDKSNLNNRLIRKILYLRDKELGSALKKILKKCRKLLSSSSILIRSLKREKLNVKEKIILLWKDKPLTQE